MVGCANGDLSGSMPDLTRIGASLWEWFSDECDRPHDTLSCLFKIALLGQGQSMFDACKTNHEFDMFVTKHCRPSLLLALCPPSAWSLNFEDSCFSRAHQTIMQLCVYL